MHTRSNRIEPSQLCRSLTSRMMLAQVSCDPICAAIDEPCARMMQPPRSVAAPSVPMTT